MVQQDNKPNMETTVDGKPLFGAGKKSQPHKVKEYFNEFQRDDDPLLSDTERGNTRADILDGDPDKEDKGMSHPG